MLIPTRPSEYNHGAKRAPVSKPCALSEQFGNQPHPHRDSHTIIVTMAMVAARRSDGRMQAPTQHKWLVRVHNPKRRRIKTTRGISQLCRAACAKREGAARGASRLARQRPIKLSMMAARANPLVCKCSALRHTDRRTDTQPHTQTNKHTHTDKHASKHTNTQTPTQPHTPTNKQTNK